MLTTRTRLTRIKSIDNKLSKYSRLYSQSEDIETLIDLAEETNDEAW